MSDDPLKVGLFLDDFVVNAWVADNIQHIIGRADLEVAVIVMNEGVKPRPGYSSFFDKLVNNRAIFYRYDEIDKQRANGSTETTVDVRDLLKDVPVVGVTPKMTKFSDRFPKSDITRIESYGLDFAFRFGFRIIRGAILDCSCYGIFSFHHDDNDVYRGGPPGFWEVYEGNPVSGVTLQILTDTLDGGVVFAKTWRRTHPTSPRMNQLRLFHSGNILVRQLCDYLTSQRPTVDELSERCTTSQPYNKQIYVKPTNLQTVKLLCKIMFRSLSSKWSLGKNTPHWSVGIAKSKSEETALEKIGVADPTWYTPPDCRFVADPFAIRRNDQLFLFVEELEYSAWKGRISVMNFDDDTGFSEPQTVLETDYHLSFPFLVEDKGNLFMIPEQAAANKIIMYRCKQFPDQWTEERVLIDDYRGIDTVVYRHGDYWWLFTTDGHNDNFDSNLNLFYSESLDGEFRPHRQNPIRSSLSGSRMAGPIINENGTLYRSGQNCVVRYGESISLFEIEELSTDSYREKFIETIHLSKNSKYKDCSHTLQVVDDYVITDGMQIGRR